MSEPISSPERSPHQEIAELERLLQEKKQALAREGNVVEEREAFREAFGERYGETFTPKTVLPSLPPTLPADELTQHAAVLGTQERDEQLESLLEIAFTKGVTAAAEVARQATPWLMDELHDRLQDRYYQQLIQLRQLKAL